VELVLKIPETLLGKEIHLLTCSADTEKLAGFGY
jgi:hypothetical protein